MRTRLLLLALFLLIPSLSFGAVAFDNVVSAKTGAAGTTLTTGSFTIGAGSNRVGMIHVVTTSDVAGLTGSIGGVSGTLITGSNVIGNAGAAAILCVINPPSGSQTATASWTTSQNAAIAAVTVTGGNQATGCNNGTNTFTGSVASGSLTVTSNNGDLTSTTLFFSNATPPSTNQTSKWSQSSVGTGSAAGDIGPGTGTTTHTWSGATTFYTISGANFIAAGGGSSCPKTLLTMGVGC